MVLSAQWTDDRAGVRVTVPSSVGSDLVSLVDVNGCVSALPLDAVYLSTACTGGVRMPGCRPNSTVSVTVRPAASTVATREGNVWVMTWDLGPDTDSEAWVFRGNVADNGLFIHWGEEVTALPATLLSDWVTIVFTFSVTHTETLVRMQASSGHDLLFSRARRPMERVRCVMGPADVWVYSVSTVDTLYEGQNLVLLAEDPSACLPRTVREPALARSTEWSVTQGGGGFERIYTQQDLVACKEPRNRFVSPHDSSPEPCGWVNLVYASVVNGTVTRGRRFCFP